MNMAGRAWKFGNDLDTDAIIPGRYIANWNKEPEKLKHNCFADVRPEYAKEVRAGDYVVAGKNFGCGSSREAAPVSIKMTGVKIIIAETFARIFYRNCINVGLLALESAEAARGIDDANTIEVDAAQGVIRNITKGESYSFKPVPPFLQEILNVGGLGPYIQKRLGIT
jgi:3-isopropylmalate/(R)-2-methylmalate dehydratase small subunit